ncbi:Transforming growth factor-beta-induced protein ig-h3 [Anthophora plagiata]
MVSLDRTSHDPRPRLSASQQAQILSDVQQHQQRYRRPNSQQDSSNSRGSSVSNYDHIISKPEISASYASLAKYKVDRTKQQQLQQLLQQQQQVQQLIQEQQQKITQQLSNPVYLNTHAQLQAQPVKQQQFQKQFNSQYQNTNRQFQNLQQDLSQPLFSDQQTLQLQEYLEKQRELELVQKQRQQLLLDQQELRRQQELLRVQQLQKLTSTTSSPIPVTSASTIALSTTASPILVSLPTARKITPSETDLFLKAIATHQKKYSTTPIPATTTTRTTTLKTFTSASPKTYQQKVTATPSIPENILNLIQEQENHFLQQGKPKPQIKVIYQTEKPVTSRNVSGKSRPNAFGSERDILLKQLKLALSQSVDDNIRNVSTRDIVLPNGKKIQLIDSSSSLTSILPTDGSTLTTSTLALTSSTTTIKPPKAIFEELTKGVLPPGADFEVIRQKSDGKLEEIGKAPIQSLPAKKVTFVVLEEQADGSYKVQGVKGNTDKEGSEVDSIVEKIKTGELKLPPSSSNPTTSPSLHSFASSLDPNAISTRQNTVTSTQSIGSTTSRPTTVRSTSVSSRYTESRPTEYFSHVTISPNSVSTTDKYVSSASSVTGHVFNSLGTVNTTPKLNSLDQESRVTMKYPSSTRSHFIPTMAPVNEIITTTAAPVPTTFTHHSTNPYIHFTVMSLGETLPTLKTTTVGPSTNLRNENIIHQDNFERSTFPPTTEFPSTHVQIQESLTTLLRREGLFAMAKYLRQSGLDNVLNETETSSADMAIGALERKTKTYEDLHTKFDKVQAQIETIVAGSDSEEVQLEEREEFENTFFVLMNKVDNYILDLRGPQRPVASPSTLSANITDSQNAPRLPTIVLPNFDGRYDHWDASQWPSVQTLTQDVPEVRKGNATCLALTGIAHKPFDLFSRYSSYSKLRRVTAYCLRFSKAMLRTTKRQLPSHSDQPSSLTLTTRELIDAERILVRLAQREQFKSDIALLTDNKPLTRSPYTIFVPSDKAFRTLLVQLGGPEKAEQKFRDNPRLLSGLLLHHVIPGAFRIDSLQDEMTGVSLAGTQLRVNEYAMHDHEWNDIRVTTINGAKVAPNKRNIEIPQGVAHAIDRVMFPLPVGDLVQTMQADRERRFTTFLKMLYISGLQDTLSGPKTFTVFAPTDSAFESAAKDGTPVWTEEDGPEAAKTIISRHVMPSTLYTAGMRYYLQKDTLRPQSPVHIHKNGGRVRVNEVHVVTHNVPAINGVLHAIDGVL